jgi:hypothetical protein
MPAPGNPLGGGFVLFELISAIERRVDMHQPCDPGGTGVRTATSRSGDTLIRWMERT